jgi:rhodanese-related sulfurtransferase
MRLTHEGNRTMTDAFAKIPTLAEIATKVARGEMLLLDVREAAELAASGKARGALHIPLGVLPLKADPQAPDAFIRPGKPVAIYCAAGGRAGRAAEMLQSMGYGPVWNLGGLGDWVASGGQLERA